MIKETENKFTRNFHSFDLNISSAIFSLSDCRRAGREGRRKSHGVRVTQIGKNNSKRGHSFWFVIFQIETGVGVQTLKVSKRVLSVFIFSGRESDTKVVHLKIRKIKQNIFINKIKNDNLKINSQPRSGTQSPSTLD